MNRSSYYKWKKSSKSKKELQDEELAALILEYHETFDGILGYRRMTTFINKFNEKDYSWKYVRRIMRMLKVKSRIRQKKSNYKKVKPEQVGENVLNRQFKADYPNQKWLTDVTEFKIVGHKQKIYLSAILDLYGKNIVAYKLSYRNDNKLVFDTFNLANGFEYDKVVYADGIIPSKPAPDIYEIAAKNLNLAPQDCIVVEDAISGINSARDAKIGKIIAICTEEPPELYQAIPCVTGIINDFTEFDKDLFEVKIYS